MHKSKTIYSNWVDQGWGLCHSSNGSGVARNSYVRSGNIWYVAKLKEICNHKDQVMGIKFGRSSSELIASFGTDSIGEFVKSKKLYNSQIKVYLVTESQGKCTCKKDFPSLEIYLSYDNATLYDKGSVVHYRVLHDLCERVEFTNECNPSSVVCLAKNLVKCAKSHILTDSQVPMEHYL